MKTHSCEIEGAYIIEPRVFEDERGAFFETYREDVFKKLGITETFVQDNRSVSCKGVLRGLHYQINNPQGHLVTLTHGKIFDVGVDLRKTSPSFGKITTAILTADPPIQLFLPPGVAHGFYVLSDRAEIWYRCTGFYDPDSEAGIKWNDPDLNIPWPDSNPTLNAKDATYPLFKDIENTKFPKVKP